MSFLARKIYFLAWIWLLSAETVIYAAKEDLWLDLVKAWREQGSRGASPGLEWDSVEEDDEFSRLLSEDSVEEGPSARRERFIGDEPIKGSSLVFVFDSTGSMKPELAQVKIGASKILEALRIHPDVPIHNYIMIPFKDPDIGPVTVTTDHNVFKESMENITAFGGGDCPEATIAAVRKALQISLPHSYIYVFTDAAAKDYRYQNEVLSLIQRKKSQVDFVMTDDCGSTLEEGYKVYEKIAETSSGQLYRLNKDEVEEVLKYVKVALQSNVVNLLSQHKPAPGKDSPDEHEVVVDKTLQEFTISVSGKNPSINLTDPKGENVDGPPKLKSLLHLDNVKIVSVKEPDPGSWKVMINSDSDYRLRSTGLSGVNFLHGFSTVDTNNIKETNYRPLKGAVCYLLIETDPKKVHNITLVDLVNLNGDIIQRLDLVSVFNNKGLYKTMAFLPPTDFFYIGVLGYGKDGLPIKRVTTTAINPQSPEKPIISMAPRISTVLHSRGDVVTCYVESVVPFTVEWYINGSFSGTEQNCSQTCEVTFPMRRIYQNSEGNYTCLARNIAGTAKGSTVLTVLEPLTIVVEPEKATYLTGDSLRISCSASGKPQPQVEWRRNNQKISEEDPRIVIRQTSGSAVLKIDYSLEEYAGLYTCRAYTPEETVEASAELIYTEKPSIAAEKKTIRTKNDEEVVLRCSATGIPKPRINWYKDGDRIAEEPRIEVQETGELRIKRTRASDSGKFSCEAESSAGTDTDYIELFVGTYPVFLQTPKDRKIEINQKATLPCSAIGIPTPEIRWERAHQIDLSPKRATVSSNGALVILNMGFEDVGDYICIAENVFGAVATEVKIDIHGIEKPIVNDGVVLSEVKGIGGSDLRIPCGVNLGNPPGTIRWFKDGHPIAEDHRTKIYENGDLQLFNSTAFDRGSYSCFVSNWAGNSSRTFDIFISESPKIAQNFSSNLKGQKGGEIVIPCPAEGYPSPSITWTKNGHPLPISSTIFQSENGSLIIRNLDEENSGIYVCISQNSAGSASRAISVQVQVPPVFTEEALDESMKIVEGYVVLLNCNTKAHPKAAVEWFKDGKPLLKGKVGIQDQPESLRFVARVEDDGLYRCVARNEAGSTYKEFNVTILVPPSISDSRTGASIKAKAGEPLILECKVRGVPAPTILWQRNGMYVTQNTSEITVLESGHLVLENVTKDSTGAYVCDAENLAGIVQRVYYVQVHYAPRIREEYLNDSISLKEGEEYSLPCSAEGNPKPLIAWRKNGFLLKDDGAGNMIILGDNTLVLLQAKQETRGTYKCEATNEEGSAVKEYKIEIISPPSLSPVNHHTRKKVNEGEPIMLTCPISNSLPRPTIQWLKDGKPVNVLLQERSDETIIKLSDDQRELTIVEAHPSDRGNYSCTATNSAGRADAKFLVDVLMTPHFEEFNHIAHRTILTGGEVDLNCSVSGNPQPKVTWRKEDAPITPEKHPGIYISPDQQHLLIQNGKIHHSGTYICTAVNEVNRKEREFYISVLEPPFITGSLHENKDVVAGQSLTLHCPSSGVPQPNIIWFKLGQNKTAMNGSGEILQLVNTKCEDEGTYMCEVTNTAGTKTKKFTVTVLEPPGIESHNVVDKLITQVGGNVSMTCKTKGHPKPDITWLHRGRIIHKIRTKRDTRDELEFLGNLDLYDDGFVSLTISNVTRDYEGMYTILASNKVGVVEKNFEVSVLSSPTLPYADNYTETITTIRAYPIVLKCPALGDPHPEIHWFLDDVPLIEDAEFIFIDDELHIINSNGNHSGRYRCLAENDIGNVTLDFIVRVVEPPVLENTNLILNVKLNETLTLHCKDTDNDATTYLWLHKSEQLNNSSRTCILDNGTKLVVSNVVHSDSGEYICIASNIAGFTKIDYKVQIIEAPVLNDISFSDYYKKVELHHPTSLNCSLSGRPEPYITWYKDGKQINHNEEERIQRIGPFLIISNSVAEDAGEYKCVAENAAGVEEMTFVVDIYVSAVWSQWSEWHSCSVSCGIGEQMRTRICEAAYGNSDKGLLIDKSNCEGENTEIRKCISTCKVDGGWGDWSDWTSYSATCGKAVRRRNRSCNNPVPLYNGQKCEGPKIMEEYIEFGKCPTEVKWSEWSLWSSCTRSCGGGIRKRFRKCESYQNGLCFGSPVEFKPCNQQKCPEAWMEWSDWSPCSATCGRGQRKRVRKCAVRGECRGENLEIEKCVIGKCPGSDIPSSANFKVTGKLNGRNVEDRFDVNIENSKNERIISANMNDLLKDQDKWFPYAQFLLSPLSWNTAYENDNADNGYSLTNGNYFSQSDIKFATGEELVVKHHGNGVNADGALEVQIEVVGEVPLIEPHASVIIQNVDQDYVQTGTNTLYSNMQNDIYSEEKKFPFTWNSSVSYNNAQGTMPYLVEKLSIKDIRNYYDPDTQNLTYFSSSAIGKRYEENECPRGFTHTPELMHCQDIDECEIEGTQCRMNEYCENTFGSFKCLCKDGFTPDRESSVCLDIDECLLEQSLCSHFCYNSPGSYSCSCPYGFYLTQDLRTCNELLLDEDSFYVSGSRLGNNLSHPRKFREYIIDGEEFEDDTENVKNVCPPGFFFHDNECKDRDECLEEDDLCDQDEICLNTLGSYQCLNIPCPYGFVRDFSSKNCIKQCKSKRSCRSNTLLSEVVSFHAIVKGSPSPFSEIIKLNVIAEDGVNIASTKFRVVESDNLFRVRELHGKGSLYALKILNKDTLYRVKVEARAFDANNVFLYYIEFIVFIIVI